MSHMLKLNVGFELIGGGPLVPEATLPSFANMFKFQLNLNIMSIYIYYFKQQIMIISIKLVFYAVLALFVKPVV